ncbi:MAG: glycosyltransferase [Verrucomicrobiota bacterium]
MNKTNFDNTPVSVIKAMACGLCVVSTDVGGMPFLWESEREGLLVRRDHPEAMAAAISRLLRETGLARQLSRQARFKATQFDWSVVLPLWERLLSDVGRGTIPLPRPPGHSCSTAISSA